MKKYQSAVDLSTSKEQQGQQCVCLDLVVELITTYGCFSWKVPRIILEGLSKENILKVHSDYHTKSQIYIFQIYICSASMKNIFVRENFYVEIC